MSRNRHKSKNTSNHPKPIKKLIDGSTYSPNSIGGRIDLEYLRDKLFCDELEEITKLQNKYSDLTNVNSLKIKYNRMLGYHIEVRAVHDKALRDKDIFIHRQTTAQTSRFTTIELNEAENQLINSYDKSISIEMDIFKK